MPKNKSKRSGKGKSRGLRKPAELPSTMLTCPLGYAQRFISACRFETDTYTTVLQDDLAITTDGSGLLQSVIADDVTITGNWASLKLCFDEYRVVSMLIKFCPLWAAGGSTALFFAPIVTCVDLNSASAMTSYDLTNQYSSAKEHPGQKPWTVEAIMSGSNESTFFSTAAPNIAKYVKFYSSGNSVTTTVGRVQRCLVVQFRGKGV